MKVLFVSSGNATEGISPIVKRQGESLSANGIDVQFATINGKGLSGYLKNFKRLKNTIQSTEPDLIHAHYSLSAFLATLAAGSKHLVVSLMGSDASSSFFYKCIIRVLIRYRWQRTIVKSKDTLKRLASNQGLEIIPNGVNIHVFKPLDKEMCRSRLNWDPSKIHLLFAANPEKPVKNYPLTLEAFKRLNRKDVELHHLKDTPPGAIPIWMNASDILLLSSKWEGSPNVVKEAMACNRCVVSTNVGDVEWLFGNLSGYFIAEAVPEKFAGKILAAIDYLGKKNNPHGRERIKELGLDADTIAQKIIHLYDAVTNKNGDKLL